MSVSSSTAFEDARRALQCAIWQRQGKKIQGPQWITVTPGGAPPEDLGCSAQAWTATLRLAAEILEGWQYELPKPSVANGDAMLDKSLNRSVRLLHGSMTGYRPIGVSTACNHGGGA